jgi:GH18 family chitinase
MKRKPQLISILLVVASFLFSNFGIGFLPAMASNHIGSSMSVPVVRPSNKVVVNPNETQLTKPDPITDTTYHDIDYNTTRTDIWNFTSARVLKPVFNRYIDPSLTDPNSTIERPKVLGYYTDWSQYDARLDYGYGPWDVPPCSNDPNPYNCYVDSDSAAGRGYDLGKVDPLAYDEIVFGFVGICGERGRNSGVVSDACELFELDEDEATFIDPYADIAAWRNNKFTKNECDEDRDIPCYEIIPNHVQDFMNQENAFGLLGGLAKLQTEASGLGHDLKLAFSIGGWSMSGQFSGIAKDPIRRSVFINSILNIFHHFPMFSKVDIDWEYPGVCTSEMENLPDDVCDEETDGIYFADLIRELDVALEEDPLIGPKEIYIAANASPVIMKKSNIQGLFDNGLDGINLMTYDFFGGTYMSDLNHHTNLSAYDNGVEVCHNQAECNNSIERSIEYLRSINVDLSKVNIGYAGYSRNALNAEINSFSPLQGTLEISESGQGTFENLSSEYNDILYNYFDPENKTGKNGYNVYTDIEANADYLYNDNLKVFMSIDTPRSVKEKGKYALDNGLGGIFTWTIDQDAGLLANAAREGAGYEKVAPSVIDMSEFYFKGCNIDGNCPPPSSPPEPPPVEPEVGDCPLEPGSNTFTSPPVAEVKTYYSKGGKLLSSVDAIFNNTGYEQNFYFFTYAADPMHQGKYVSEQNVWVSGGATDEKRSNLFESENVGFKEVNVESPGGYEGTITVKLIGHCFEP